MLYSVWFRKQKNKKKKKQQGKYQILQLHACYLGLMIESSNGLGSSNLASCNTQSLCLDQLYPKPEAFLDWNPMALPGISKILESPLQWLHPQNFTQRPFKTPFLALLGLGNFQEP